MRWRTRRLPSCHQACVRPVSSRSFFGSLKKIWQETANTNGSANPLRSGDRKSSSTRMSLFSSTTMSLEAARNPAFDPPPNPRLRSSASSFTRGNAFRTNSALPSVDPLSTTTISFAGLPASGRHNRRQVLSEQVLAVPVGDHHRGRRRIRRGVSHWDRAPEQFPEEVGDRQGDGADRHRNG